MCGLCRRKALLSDPKMGSRYAGTWAWVGLGAQILLVVSWIAGGFWQGPRYSVLTDSISDMYAVTAPGAMVLVVIATMCGLATILFAWLSVWPSLRTAGRTAAIGAALLSVSILGLGDLLSPLKRLSCRIADEGCSPGDQVADIGGQLDLIVSLAGILFYIGAAFFLSAAMARVPGWHDLAGRARWFGIAFIVLLVASVVIGGLGVFGLMNRLLAITGAAGLAVLAWRIALPVPRSYGPENAARR